MAIRDRLTVYMKSGLNTTLEVAKQGGAIEFKESSKNEPWLRAWILDKNGNRTEESIAVADSEIAWYTRDQASKVKTPKK